MSEEFKPGDVVELKSGGPLMTIVFIEEKNNGAEACCTWFNYFQFSYEPKKEVFKLYCIEKAKK